MRLSLKELENIAKKSNTKAELLIETRHRYLMMLKGTYWHFFEEGLCSSKALLVLIESVDRALDHD